MHTLFKIFSAALLFAGLARADAPQEAAPATPAGELSFRVFQRAAAERGGNILFSPSSMESLLGVFRDISNGETRKALDAAHLGTATATPLVKSATAFIVESTLPLRENSAEVPLLRLPVSQHPEAAAAAVNAWCREHTDGHIHEVVAPDSFSGGDAAAVSAILFRGKWEEPFKSEFTTTQPFHLKDGGEKPVELMRQWKNLLYAEAPDGSWRAVAVPYLTEGEPVYFIGILPEGDARAFARDLTAEVYHGILEQLTAQGASKVLLYLPHVRLRSTLQLRDILSDCGLKPLFSGAADLLLTHSPADVKDMLQICTLELNHKETVASAVTVSPCIVVGLSDRDRPPYVIMRFDRPFVWSIGTLSPDDLPYFIGLFESP